MGLPPLYIIGAESIGDYLRDIETRWGVRLEFRIALPRSQAIQAPFVVWLVMPSPLHQQEITWWDDLCEMPDTKHSIDLVRLMWDMLYMADQILVKGPEDT